MAKEMVSFSVVVLKCYNACSTKKVSHYILASCTAVYYCISCLKHVGGFLVRLGSKIFHTSWEAFILPE